MICVQPTDVQVILVIDSGLILPPELLVFKIITV